MERTQRRLIIALALSLGANLFVAGFAVARHVLVRRAWGARAHMMEPHGFFGHVGLGGGGPQVRRVLESKGDALRAQQSAVRTAREKVRDALALEPFDRGKLDAALAELRTQTAQLQATMHAAVGEVASSLDGAQRKRLANAPWFLRAPGWR